MSGILQAAAAATRREQALLTLRTGYAPEVTALPDKLGALVAAITVFDGHHIAYALIGGLAVGMRSGVPRATLDVDFAIPTSVDRSSLAVLLVQQGGFRKTGEFAHSLNFEHETGEPVQLAFDEWFDPMIARAETLRSEQIELRVVTKADLIEMKRRAAADPARRRSKALRDQADVALLEGDVPEPNEGW
jgi:hypothetical protein